MMNNTVTLYALKSMESLGESKGTVCRAIRQALFLSQKDIAELLDCSKTTISLSERELEGPSRKWIEAEFSFLQKVLFVLDENERKEVLSLAATKLALEHKTREYGKVYKRR